MADRYSEDGAAANGFGRRSLQPWEVRLLHEAGYPAPPDIRCPLTWRLSAGGVPVPPVPQGQELQAEIDMARNAMSPEERNEPQHHPVYIAGWTEYFSKRREQQLAVYEGVGPPPVRQNAAGQRHWWSEPGRTLHAVLEHIAGGNTPRLRRPSAVRKEKSRRESMDGTWLLRKRKSPLSTGGGASGSSGGDTSPSPAPAHRDVLRARVVLKPKPETQPRRRIPAHGAVLRACVVLKPESLSSPCCSVRVVLSTESSSSATPCAWSKDDAERARQPLVLGGIIILDDSDEEDADPSKGKGPMPSDDNSDE